MKNKSGETIVSCCMADDTANHGNCATCMHWRGWWNTTSLHEGDEDYCDDKSAVTQKSYMIQRGEIEIL